MVDARQFRVQSMSADVTTPQRCVDTCRSIAVSLSISKKYRAADIQDVWTGIVTLSAHLSAIITSESAEIWTLRENKYSHSLPPKQDSSYLNCKEDCIFLLLDFMILIEKD